MTTIPHANLVVSFVMATRNRRDVLLHTLWQVRACGLHPEAFEILVVDNASTDGTPDAVEARFPDVKVLRQRRNHGSCAKNLAVEQARARYVVFLDDDSFPMPGSIRRMIRHFESDPRLGAAVFTITLPDGSRECSAYPDVFIGCGTGFRRRALAEVGGLPEGFFMQAEEYDLSLRLLQAGWTIRSFDDLHVAHLKTSAARSSSRTMRLDVRNNLLIATRYFPSEWLKPMAWDWMRRYYKLAASSRRRRAFVLGLVQGIARSLRKGHRRPVDADVFEHFAKPAQIESGLRSARDRFGLRRVLLVDLGKNVLAFYRAARRLEIDVVAIADAHLAGRGKYRGIPIVNDAIARRMEFDAAIVSNLSPVHAQRRRLQWQHLDTRPIIDVLQAPIVQRATSDLAA